MVKYLKKYKLFEARFSEFREIISTLKDICQEFEDNNCNCKIEPSDDIQLNIISLKSRGHLDSLKINFYIDIRIDGRVQIDDKRSGMGPFAEWFIDNCKRIEEFMSTEGFKTLPSINYPFEWEHFDNIDELEYAMGLIKKVRLRFVPTAKPLDESLEYNDDWKKHDSPIRKELELDLNDILLEITDMGFTSRISGWTSPSIRSWCGHPYVWIKRTTNSPVPMKDYTHETVERIKDYLSQKGFQTKVDIINVDRPAMQIYIFFDKEIDNFKNKYIDIEHLRESTDGLDYDYIKNIKDILLPFSDMGMDVTCDYIENGDNIIIKISTSKEKAFDINDYKYDIDALLSYMRENKWVICNFNVGTVEKVETWHSTQLLANFQQIMKHDPSFLTDPSIILKFNGPIQYDEVENPIFWITTEFSKVLYDDEVKSIKESIESDEIKKDIEEICYELTDYNRFKVDIDMRQTSHSNYYQGSVEVPEMWYISILLLDHLDYDGFLLSEVEDTLIRLKSYLGERFIGGDVLLVGEPNRTRLFNVTNEDRLTNITIYYTL